MSNPEFFTTGAPASALSVKVDHYLDYQGKDIFSHTTALTTLNKLEIIIADPIGESSEAKKRIDAIVKDAQDAMAPFTTKTELWGNTSVAFLIRQWRTAFIDAIMIGRALKVSNNDYSKFSVDNIKDVSYRMAGMAAGQGTYIRDNMADIVNRYLDLCEQLESVCVPYFKQLTDIFEILSCFYVDTDPEKKLPSLLAAYPSSVLKFNLDGTTTRDSFYLSAGNNMANMLDHFEANIDAMKVIVVDGKNYAADMKTALAKVYKAAPIKKGFFREYITTPLAWYAHKLKAAQFRNGSTTPMTTMTVDLAAGTFSFSTPSAISAEIKGAFNKVVVDLYTDDSWKDFSKSLAAQCIYCPVLTRDGSTFTVRASSGIFIQCVQQLLAANTYDDTISGFNSWSKWVASHSTNQDEATKGLRGWMSVAQCYSDAPLEFADHHDETWFTGKIDDMVELSTEQRMSILNLIVSCMVRIHPKDAMQSMSGNRSQPARGRTNRGKGNNKKGKE